jgi:hypothetical protein
MHDRLFRMVVAIANAPQALRARAARTAADDRGQTSAEYLGILVLVGAIIVFIMGLGLDEKIGDAIEAAIDTIIDAGP